VNYNICVLLNHLLLLRLKLLMQVCVISLTQDIGYLFPSQIFMLIQWDPLLQLYSTTIISQQLLIYRESTSGEIKEGDELIEEGECWVLIMRLVRGGEGRGDDEVNLLLLHTSKDILSE
jgi:hypothetical protein